MGRGFRLTPNYILFGGCEVTYYVDTNEVYEETIEEGADATQPESFTPTKTGYTFLGWRTDTVAAPSVLSSYTIQEDQEILSLYAVFKNSSGYYNNTAIANVTTDYTSPGINAVQLYAGITYLFEVWGAQGNTGNSSYPGGKGGYSKGNYTPDQDEVVYAVVGGQNSYNGGGGGASAGNQWSFWSNNIGYYYNGGGASHIGKVNGLLSATPQASLLIVAGGGGGTGHEDHWNETSNPDHTNRWYLGGYGGGTSGQTPGHNSGNGNAGTQSSGYAYGQGGPGGGGGGYYGGYGAPQGSDHRPYYGSGAGGSGYIGGVTNGSTTGNSKTGNGQVRITIVA